SCARYSRSRSARQSSHAPGLFTWAQYRAGPVAPPCRARSALPEEACRVAPKQFLARLAAEARPGQHIVDRTRKLAFGVRIVRGVHQDAVAQKRGDHAEHFLALLPLDAAEEPAARQVFARLHLELLRRADIGVLLVHA